MSVVAPIARVVRNATDPLAVFSFSRMGFELNRRGFESDDPPRGSEGRIALVTGANSGIGFATARELARRGFCVWMLCRDPVRGAQARDSIARECGQERVQLAVVDVSSLRSIRRFVRETSLRRVDVLVHNAGVLPHEKRLSDDGVELTFATHVLGPFALTALLMGALSQSSDARVIFVASAGLYLKRLDLSVIEIEAAQFDGTRAYANAKRAQVILAQIFAERFAGVLPVTFASMHPGWVDTAALRTSLPRFHSVMRHLLRSADQGADTVVWLAASPRAKGTRGAFWFDRRVAPEYPMPWTHERPGVREQLVGLCERLSSVTFVDMVAPQQRVPTPPRTSVSGTRRLSR